MHLNSTQEEVPLERVWISLICLIEHHDGPHTPVEIVEYHALLNLADSFLTHGQFHRPLCALTSFLLLQFVVAFGNFLNLLLCRPVL